MDFLQQFSSSRRNVDHDWHCFASFLLNTIDTDQHFWLHLFEYINITRSVFWPLWNLCHAKNLDEYFLNKIVSNSSNCNRQTILVGAWLCNLVVKCSDEKLYFWNKRCGLPHTAQGGRTPMNMNSIFKECFCFV